MTAGTDVAPSKVFEQAMALAAQAMTGAVIGKIESYNPVTNRANVTTLVPILVDAEGTVDPVLTMTDVPVMWQQAHNAAGALQHSVKFPLPTGSFVFIDVLQHDHTPWIISGTQGIPSPETRRFDISDVVVRPISPTPLAKQPVEPLSYDAAAAVLYGLWCVGSNVAGTKAAALNLDSCPAVSSMRVWMGQVETAINAAAGSPPGPPVITPLSSTFTSTAIAQVTATATKLRGI